MDLHHLTGKQVTILGVSVMGAAAIITWVLDYLHLIN
jgi:hypothetical protein